MPRVLNRPGATRPPRTQAEQLRVGLPHCVGVGGGITGERFRLGLSVRADAAVANSDLAIVGRDFPELG